MKQEEEILPTFLIGGAPKAGTTFLYHYCKEHPDVCMSSPKETGFFHKNYDKGLGWFKRHFDHWEGETAIGEASVMTFPTPGAEQRVADVVPEVRLIFLLRNPIERAYSDYLYNLQQGWIPPDVTFHQMIRGEVDVKGHSGEALINRGLYLKHLHRFEKHFKRSRMCIILTRDLKEDPISVVRSVYDFIEVSTNYLPETMEQRNTTNYIHHKGAYQILRAAWQPVKRVVGNIGPVDTVRDRVRSYFFGKDEKPEMRPEDRAYLRERYESPNERLAEWLGRDLSHWT